MPNRANVHIFLFFKMIVSTASTTQSAALVAEFSGGAQSSVDIMLGIGLQKDSEAVFFQYKGDDTVEALVQASGKPVTRIAPVRLTGITIADGIYKDAGFDGSKVNIFLETQSGRTVMLTSGLTTIWTQCIMTSLMGLVRNDSLDHLIAIDTWKGTSKMRPCFAAVRDGSVKVTDDEMYRALTDARSDRDRAKTEALVRDAVEIIGAQLNGIPATVTDVTDYTETEDQEVAF